MARNAQHSFNWKVPDWTNEVYRTGDKITSEEFQSTDGRTVVQLIFYPSGHLFNGHSSIYVNVLSGSVSSYTIRLRLLTGEKQVSWISNNYDRPPITPQKGMFGEPCFCDQKYVNAYAKEKSFVDFQFTFESAEHLVEGNSAKRAREINSSDEDYDGEREQTMASDNTGHEAPSKSLVSSTSQAISSTDRSYKHNGQRAPKGHVLKSSEWSSRHPPSGHASRDCDVHGERSSLDQTFYGGEQSDIGKTVENRSLNVPSTKHYGFYNQQKRSKSLMALDITAANTNERQHCPEMPETMDEYTPTIVRNTHAKLVSEKEKETPFYCCQGSLCTDRIPNDPKYKSNCERTFCERFGIQTRIHENDNINVFAKNTCDRNIEATSPLKRACVDADQPPTCSSNNNVAVRNKTILDNG